MIRQARADDAPTLSQLAFRSKANWGYDAAFMAACRPELTVTAEQLRDDACRVYQAANMVAGFYLLHVENRVGSLELFFVDPACMGRGIGAALLRHSMAEAHRRGAERVVVDSDPNAEGLYRRMGGRRIGSAASASIAGRVLPVLEFRICAKRENA